MSVVLNSTSFQVLQDIFSSVYKSIFNAPNQAVDFIMNKIVGTVDLLVGEDFQEIAFRRLVQNVLFLAVNVYLVIAVLTLAYLTKMGMQDFLVCLGMTIVFHFQRGIKLLCRDVLKWKPRFFRIKKLRDWIFNDTRALSHADLLIQDTCFICCGNFKVGDLVPSIPHACLGKHNFMHQYCSEMWFQHVNSTGNSKCPICREDIE